MESCPNFIRPMNSDPCLICISEKKRREHQGAPPAREEDGAHQVRVVRTVTSGEGGSRMIITSDLAMTAATGKDQGHR